MVQSGDNNADSTDVDFVKIASDTASAKATAEANSNRMHHLEEGLSNHIAQQVKQFHRVYDKMDNMDQKSSDQHAELASKVDANHAAMPELIAVALEPIVAEVKDHRVWLVGALGAGLILSLGVIGYLLVEGTPWAAEVIKHSNGVPHAVVQ